VRKGGLDGGGLGWFGIEAAAEGSVSASETSSVSSGVKFKRCRGLKDCVSGGIDALAVLSPAAECRTSEPKEALPLGLFS